MKMHKSLSGSEQHAEFKLQLRWLWLMAALVFASVALLALALHHLRSQTLQAAEHLNTALVNVVAEQTTRTLQAVDQSLELTTQYLVLMNDPSERNPASVKRMLQTQIGRLPFIQALWVLDLQGNRVFDSETVRPDGGPSPAALDGKPSQDYARLFALQGAPDFMLGTPQPGTQPGVWLIQAARPLRDPQGVLTGAVVAVLDLRYLDAIWAAIDLGTEGSLVLLRRDGTLLARMPYIENAMGKNFGKRPVFQTLLPASTSGNYRDHSSVDGVKRLFSYRTLASHPDLVVIAGRSESQVLERWWQWVSVVLWVWGSATAVIVLLSTVLVRAWRRTARAQLAALQSSQRFETLFLEAPDAIFFTAPDGRILAANPASCALLGWTEPELQAMGRRGLIDPTDTRLENALKQRDSTGRFRGELRFLRKGGEPFEGELLSSVFTDHEGQARATVIVRDVSERHRYENALQASTLKLQMLSRRIINAQEAERRRVANELHDELGQSLTAIKINLQSGARFKNRSPDEINQENIRIVEDALQQVRSLALALRPSILDNLGLAPALNWLGKQVAQRAGFEFEFLPPAAAHRLPPELETTCFRIVQEALTNIARHARASQVTLSMQVGAEAVTIVLSDNGLGMDWPAVRQSAQSGNSAGVLGMLERADLVGGTLELESAPGEGCTLTFTCPLHPGAQTE